MPKKGVNINKLNSRRPWDHKYDVTIQGRRITTNHTAQWHLINDDDYFEVILGGDDCNDYEDNNTLDKYFPTIPSADDATNDDNATDYEEQDDNDDDEDENGNDVTPEETTSLVDEAGIVAPFITAAATSSVPSIVPKDEFSQESVPYTIFSSTSSTASLPELTNSTPTHVVPVPVASASSSLSSSSVPSSVPAPRMRMMMTTQPTVPSIANVSATPANPTIATESSSSSSIIPSTSTPSSSSASTLPRPDSTLPLPSPEVEVPPVLELPSSSATASLPPRPTTPSPPYYVPLIAFHVGKEGTTILRQTKCKALKGLHHRFLIRFVVGRGNVIMCPLHPTGSALSPSPLSPTGTSSTTHSNGLNRTGSSGTLTSTMTTNSGSIQMTTNSGSIQITDPSNHSFANMDGIRNAILNIVFNNTANISPVYTGVPLNESSGVTTSNFTYTTIIPESLTIQLDTLGEQYFLENEGAMIRELISLYTDIQLIFHQNTLTIAPLVVNNRFVQRSKIEDILSAEQLLFRKNSHDITVINIAADDIYERLRKYRFEQSRTTPSVPQQPSPNAPSPSSAEPKPLRRFGC